MMELTAMHTVLKHRRGGVNRGRGRPSPAAVQTKGKVEKSAVQAGREGEDDE